MQRRRFGHEFKIEAVRLIKEGDRQAQEGFCDVTPAAMNPNFNTADQAAIVSVAAKRARDEREIAMAAAGASSYTTLDDRTRRSLGDVSSPYALAAEPPEIPIMLAATKASKAAVPRS